MRRGQRLVGLLWRWHRRTGVLIFLFLLLLATSGIALNHTTAIGLDARLVSWDWLIRFYGDSSAEVRAFPVGQQWLARSPAGRVYIDGRDVAPCEGELIGAQPWDGMVVAACRGELLLIAPDGQLVESVASSAGLPGPLTGLGLADGELVIELQDGWRVADLDGLAFTRAAPTGALVQQQSPGVLPAELVAVLPRGERWLTWERVLLDLHSGRIAGSGGVWLMDLVGVLLICIASSGLIMWWLHRRPRG